MSGEVDFYYRKLGAVYKARAERARIFSDLMFEEYMKVVNLAQPEEPLPIATIKRELQESLQRVIDAVEKS